MAPSRNRRRKKGLIRIDAALAATRPMGFSDSVVRKHVKNLLKVLLEPQGNQLPDEAGDRVGDYADVSGERLGSLQIQCDNQDSRGKSTVQSSWLTIRNKHNPQEDESQDEIGETQAVPQFDLAPLPSSMIMDCHKPCHGWISEDDDNNDFILLPPANGANTS